MSDTEFLDDPRMKEVSASAYRILGAGTASFDDLLAACRSDALAELAAEYNEDAATIFYEVLMWTPGVWTADDRCARLDAVVAGTVFTHRITADEIASGLIADSPDLAALDADDVPPDASLAIDGGEIKVVYPDSHPGADRNGSLLGPDGWLDRFAAGDLVAFRRAAETRRVTLSVIDEPPVDVLTVQALESELTALFTSGAGVGRDLFPVVIDAMISHPNAFRQETLPIVELLESIGCEYRDGHVGPTDRTWEPTYVVQKRLRRAQIATDFGFDTCCTQAFERIEAAWSHFLMNERLPEDVDGGALNHGGVGVGFVDWVLGDDHLGSPLLERFCDALIDTHSHHRAGAFYVRAMNRQRDGNVTGAEADLRRAAKLDPDSPVVAGELGRYAAIRGNGKEAIRLLRRSGATPETDGGVEFLIRLFERHADTPRNDPCPCESGRKYKTCCAVRPRLTDTDRVLWLQRKLYEFVAGADRSHLLWDLAAEASTADPRYDEDDADDFVNHVFLLDLAAFELSMDDFAEQCGPMLPEDERDLLDVWRLSSRRLWEVTDVVAADGRLTLRDGRTGETAEVLEMEASEHATTGDLMLARVGPGFDHDHLLGVSRRVDLRNRNELLEILDSGGDAADLARWYGWIMAPPVMTTTDGEPMVIAETRGTPRDVTWDEFITELAANYERIDDHTWNEPATNPRGETISRATITIEDDEVVIATLSEERMQRVRETLPVLTIHSETREPVDDPRKFAAALGSPIESDEPTPEMAELLAQVVNEQENKWLDESIPALGGFTPRQARDDPTRREDLLALLRSFEGAGRGGFSAARIRGKLGL